VRWKSLQLLLVCATAIFLQGAVEPPTKLQMPASPLEQSTALYGIADCYTDEGKFKEAEEALTRAADLPVGPAKRTWTQSLALARYYLKRGKYADADKYIEEMQSSAKAFDSDSKETTTTQLLTGILQGSKGKYDDALATLDTAIKNAKQDDSLKHPALLNKAYCLVQLGKTKEAKETVADLPPESAKNASEPEKNIDFGPYMAKLQRDIKSKWKPPKGNETKRVVIVFKVARDGTMTGERIDVSSKVATADEAAMTAVKSAAPFSPLPEGSPASVDIQFTFDYNVFIKKQKEESASASIVASANAQFLPPRPITPPKAGLGLPEHEIESYLFDTYGTKATKSLIDDGRKLFKSGDLLGAYNKLKKVTKNSFATPSDHAAALYALADCYAAQGSVKEAEELLKHAADLPLGDIRTSKQAFAMGRFYIERGRYEEAEAYLKEAAKAADTLAGAKSYEHGMATMALGLVYSKQNRWDDAIKQFDLVADNPSAMLSYEGKINKAFCLNAQGKLKESTELLASIKPPEMTSTSASTTTTNVDFSKYMNVLQKRIKSKWKPPKDTKTKRVVVQFKIARDGTMSGEHITKNSGVENADQAAMAALKAAAPFPPLPEGAPETVDIQFTFDYNVFTGRGY
jgi:TonB family protein